jgi:hypothetical protein
VKARGPTPPRPRAHTHARVLGRRSGRNSRPSKTHSRSLGRASQAGGAKTFDEIETELLNGQKLQGAAPPGAAPPRARSPTRGGLAGTFRVD